MISKLEDLEIQNVVELLRNNELDEFVEFVWEKKVDGRKLLDVTEGIVKLWRPRVNAKKIISFIEDLKNNPEKYLSETMDKCNEVPVECQYQTVKKTKSELAASSMMSVEDLLKKLVPPKSFLYRNYTNRAEKNIPSYLPMDVGTKKPKKFFRLSSYEYPNFDILSRFSKHENLEDRGYYSVKTNTRYYIQKITKTQDSRTKYKSLPAAEEIIEKLPEDHFYEDLCYNDVSKNEEINESEFKQVAHVKPCMVKLQELFQSFKIPFFKKPEVSVERDKKIENVDKDNVSHLYENGDAASNMYDSVLVTKRLSEVDCSKIKQVNLPVEDYLEPVVLCKDYCDVNIKQKDESLIGYIISIFESRFGLRRETNDANQSEEYDTEQDGDKEHDDRRPVDEKVCRDGNERPCNMADRPLPVPVENEPYYMNIDREEAENLLKGYADGTFVLRPSSQSNHVYTLSVCCSNAVHNVGVRRRPDGRLALGFARRGERSFTSVSSLLRHHRRRRLLLVAAGGVLGATTLNEPPQYYQTPCNIPLPKT
ncbi:unnamed protein product [Diatraea saccharalis]|uniref:SH2 domain-containing protein n=1 Tax=Diatraea saccharalis TaxID=40085 RepID=A0A9N9RCH7_9NEOP|nr:unnamed protein product [Diatraea saccharalis]